MAEITGPVIASTLVLVAVFAPVGFLPGVSGQLFRQFAVTIWVSVVISAINALTLSPALCEPDAAPADAGALSAVHRVQPRAGCDRGALWLPWGGWAGGC